MRIAAENEYIKDGLIYCKVCNTPKQMRIKNFIVEPGCDCVQKVIKAKREQERKNIIANNHRLCYSELGSENLERYRRVLKNLEPNKYTDIAEGYVEHFEEYEAKGIGLLLVGGVGTGKSTIASAIANELLLKGLTVRFTNFSHIMDTWESKLNSTAKLNYLSSLNRHRLLVIDDYGIERKNSAMSELVYKVINGRYESKRPMIITTNKDLQGASTEEQRVHDRIMAMSHVVVMHGKSRRTEEAKQIQLLFQN